MPRKPHKTIAAEPMPAPESGVSIRMYRIGHGDCFLLSLPRPEGGNPVYILIDCGMKPGSQDFIHWDDAKKKFKSGRSMKEIVSHIRAATGGHLDLMVITHEHQDHVNAIKGNFDDFTIDEAWFAWTESPSDGLAKQLRQAHHDTLLGLIGARYQLARMAGATETEAVRRLDALLELELGTEVSNGRVMMGMDKVRTEMFGAASDPERSVNKQGMRLIKQIAGKKHRSEYWKPGKIAVPKTEMGGIRAFVLGPPRSETALADEDPPDDSPEAFPRGDEHGLSFAAAARSSLPTKEGGVKALPSPFGSRYGVPLAAALAPGFSSPLLRNHYGKGNGEAGVRDKTEVPNTAAWRRIDGDWLLAAEMLALKLNTGINNTSLVLAFELPKSKKVLLFPGDAQRGNWKSWAKTTFQDGGKTLSARDILSRVVFYKVGHHGSHNATLAGTASSDYANLTWLGSGASSSEFCAMIPAVNEWAVTKNSPPWRHPLPSIYQALKTKTGGRLFQTDMRGGKNDLERGASVSEAEWADFLDRVEINEWYIQYSIPDE